MPKKTQSTIKRTTVSLAIKNTGGAYQFWRKLAEASGANDFIIQYQELSMKGAAAFHRGFVERAVGKGKTRGIWVGGEKAWNQKDNPMGYGYIGGKFVIGRDKDGIVASNSLL